MIIIQTSKVFLIYLIKLKSQISGVEFLYPNTISSCRVLDTITFGEILKKLREMTQ